MNTQEKHMQAFEEWINKEPGLIYSETDGQTVWLAACDYRQEEIDRLREALEKIHATHTASAKRCNFTLCGCDDCLIIREALKQS